LPGPTYCGTVAAGRAGSGAGGGRSAIVMDATVRLPSGRPSSFRSA
jgi:hypothetical protein